MKKRLFAALLALVLMLPLWHAASANAPVPDPDLITVTCTSVDKETTVVLLVAGEDGNFRVLDSGVSTSSTYSFLFYRDGNDTQFCVELTAKDGTRLRSDPHPMREGGTYVFHADTNEVEETKRSGNCNSAVAVVFIVFAFLCLILAIGVTIVIEMLVGLCFRMRPIRYVIIINLITNPVMNLLLLILSISVESSAAYTVALLVLEAIVCGLEFLFYTRKYRERKKWVLLLFTLIANAASATAGLLPAWLLLR